MRATAASRQDAHALLTEADVVLLERLSYGVTDEMIGWERRIPVEAVRECIDSVVSSLGAKNREHAVAIALKTGLIR